MDGSVVRRGLERHRAHTEPTHLNCAGRHALGRLIFCGLTERRFVPQRLLIADRYARMDRAGGLAVTPGAVGPQNGAVVGASPPRTSEGRRVALRW